MEVKITCRKTGLVTLDTGDPDFYVLFCGFQVSDVVLLWSKFWIQQGVSSKVLIPAIFHGQLPSGGIVFSSLLECWQELFRTRWHFVPSNNCFEMHLRLIVKTKERWHHIVIKTGLNAGLCSAL